MIKLKKYMELAGLDQVKINNQPLQENPEDEFSQRENNIRGHLKNWPEAADLLFTEYARLAGNTEQAAGEISRLYDEIFFNKKIDKNEIIGMILKRADRFLIDTQEKIKQAPENDKPALVKESVELLVRERMGQRRMLDDFKVLAFKLSGDVKQAVIQWREADWQEDRELEQRFLKQDLAEGEDLTDEDIEEILQTDRFEKSAEMAREKEDFIKNEKFDSSRTKEVIEDLESRYEKTLVEKSPLLTLKDFTKVWQVSESQAKELLEKKRRWEEERYKPYVLKLKKLLELQEALEKKLEEIIYGKKRIETVDDLEQSLPRVILNKYQELVSLINKNKKELAGLFKKQVGLKDEDLDEISESILKKAKDCLANFSQLADKGEMIDEAEVMWKLDSYEAETILQFSARKNLAKEKSVRPEDLKGVAFEKLKAGELVAEKNFPVLDKLTRALLKKEYAPASSYKGMFEQLTAHLNDSEKKLMDYVRQMMEMYKENYEETPDKLPYLLDGLRQALEKKDTVVYLYRKGEQVLAWLRYDKKGRDKKFVASFNTLPGLKGFDIGMPLFATSLEIEGSGGVEIEAEADPYKFVTPKYIENNGFVAKQAFLKNKHAYFKISRAERNKDYLFRKVSQAEIIKSGDNKGEADGDNLVLKLKAGDAQIFTAAENYLKDGFVLSRYIVKGDWVYLAFERGN